MADYEDGPARDYGPEGSGDPGYGQWDHNLGNRRGGYARNYGEEQANAYRDPAALQETDPAYDHTLARARARGLVPQQQDASRAAAPPGRARGSMAGRGPRNYRRPDRSISEDINDRLTDHSDIDASDIEVTVQDGEVVLAGTVGDREQKRLAEDVAYSVPGVRDVINRLRAAPAGGQVKSANL